MGNPFKLSAIDSYIGGSKGIRFTPEITSPLRRTTESGGLEQRIEAQNRELPPKNLSYETAGTTFTHGVGESNFGLMIPLLA